MTKNARAHTSVVGLVAMMVAIALTMTSCAVPADYEEQVNGNTGINVRTYTTDADWASWSKLYHDAVAATALGDKVGGLPVTNIIDTADGRVISTALWVVNLGVFSFTVYATTGFTTAIAQAGDLREGLIAWAGAVGIVVTGAVLGVVVGVLGLAQARSINNARMAVDQRSPNGCVKWKFGADALLKTTITATPTFMGYAGNVELSNGNCDGAARD